MLRPKLMYKILFIIGLSVIITVSPAYSNDKDGWYNILKEGGNNVGQLTTEAIKNTINKASEAGGGTIYFPAGEYLTGAIELKSNITLHLDAGAVLKFSTDFDHYLPFVKLRWEGTVMNSFSPLIYAYEAENIAIVGRGKIDGQGEAWWKEMYRVKYPKEEVPLNRYQKMWDEQNPDLETADYYQGTMKIKLSGPH